MKWFVVVLNLLLGANAGILRKRDDGDGGSGGSGGFSLQSLQDQINSMLASFDNFQGFNSQLQQQLDNLVDTVKDVKDDGSSTGSGSLVVIKASDDSPPVVQTIGGSGVDDDVVDGDGVTDSDSIAWNIVVPSGSGSPGDGSGAIDWNLVAAAADGNFQGKLADLLHSLDTLTNANAVEENQNDSTFSFWRK